jgi:putative ABC transport system permease protein
MNLVVRSYFRAAEPCASSTGQVVDVDKRSTIYNLKLMDDIISGTISQQRFALSVLAVFAGLAMVLAAVGIFGVTSYSVTQRSLQIGIHMALGLAGAMY